MADSPLPARRALEEPPKRRKSKPTPTSDLSQVPRRGVIEDDSEATAVRELGVGARLLRFAQEAVIVLLVALLISTAIKVFIGRQFLVPSSSMEQTLLGNHEGQSGDRIWVSKLSDYHRGDIIVFEDKLGWLPPSQQQPTWFEKSLEFVGLLPPAESQFLVKRLIGLPGDRVTCCTNNRITVNGSPLEEDYLFVNASGEMVNPSDVTFDLIVPASHVFVLGDHRDASADSRAHLCATGGRTPNLGFPAIQDIQGPVSRIVLPFSRWTGFDTPATFAKVPAPTQPPPAQPDVRIYPGC